MQESGQKIQSSLGTCVFADMPVDNAFSSWVEQLAAEGIMGGCGGSNFYPKTVVNREQMASFLVPAFSMP